VLKQVLAHERSFARQALRNCARLEVPLLDALVPALVASGDGRPFLTDLEAGRRVQR
jgi:hypothetical protein